MKFIEHLDGLVSSKIEIAKGIYTLFKLEAKLAGMNIYPLLFSLCLLIPIVLTLWLSLMVLIAYLMFVLTDMTLIAIITVLILNLGISIYLIKNLKGCLQQMSFKNTRACFDKPQLSDTHESTKEKTADVNS